MLEIERRQLEQVIEDVGPEHRVDPVAGVQDQVLAHPAEQAREDDEDQHPHPKRDQSALGAVDDHLFDDHLRDERQREREHLQHE